MTDENFFYRTLLKSKIHRATVTDADLDYEGSITVDQQLMQAADLLPNEKVDIYNITNGERFHTYVIPGPAASGMIGINGAAAHKAGVGDLVIIASYVQMSADQAQKYRPKIVKVTPENQPLKTGPIRLVR